jgi:predicted HicB family RNase H-like nuclease
MAQLKSSNSEIRSKQIIVRVTPTERKRLEREAKAAKVLLSQWMRRKLLDTPA